MLNNIRIPKGSYINNGNISVIHIACGAKPGGNLENFKYIIVRIYHLMSKCFKNSDLILKLKLKHAVLRNVINNMAMLPLQILMVSISTFIVDLNAYIANFYVCERLDTIRIHAEDLA